MHLIEGMFSFVHLENHTLSFRDYIFAIGCYLHEELTVQLMNALANGYASQGEFEKAKEFYAEVQRKTKESGNLQELGYVLGNLGFFHNNYLKDYSEAASYYLEGLVVEATTNSKDTRRASLVRAWCTSKHQ